MSKKKGTIGSQMLAMKVLLANMNEPTLQATMATYGYDAARLAEGLALYEATQAELNEQQRAKILKTQTTLQKSSSYQAALTGYQKNVTIARRALKGDEASLGELGLTGKRPAVFEVWFKVARDFYAAALNNAEILAKMAPFGVTAQSLQNDQLLLDTLETVHASQKNRIGLSQVATTRRDEKLTAMLRWYADFIAMARIAFKNYPQHLERFGVVVLSPGYQRKKKETPPKPQAWSRAAVMVPQNQTQSLPVSQILPAPNPA